MIYAVKKAIAYVYVPASSMKERRVLEQVDPLSSRLPPISFKYQLVNFKRMRALYLNTINANSTQTSNKAFLKVRSTGNPTDRFPDILFAQIRHSISYCIGGID